MICLALRAHCTSQAEQQYSAVVLDGRNEHRALLFAPGGATSASGNRRVGLGSLQALRSCLARIGVGTHTLRWMLSAEELQMRAIGAANHLQP